MLCDTLSLHRPGTGTGLRRIPVRGCELQAAGKLQDGEAHACFKAQLVKQADGPGHSIAYPGTTWHGMAWHGRMQVIDRSIRRLTHYVLRTAHRQRLETRCGRTCTGRLQSREMMEGVEGRRRGDKVCAALSAHASLGTWTMAAQIRHICPVLLSVYVAVDGVMGKREKIAVNDTWRRRRANEDDGHC